MTASRPVNEAIFHTARDIPDPDRRRGKCLGGIRRGPDTADPRLGAGRDWPSCRTRESSRIGMRERLRCIRSQPKELTMPMTPSE